MPFGVDPKTILCAYFKAGFCERGAKCKFSHDKDVERKVEKRNLYEDKRDETGVCLNLVFSFLGGLEGMLRGLMYGVRYDGDVGRR